MSTVVRPLVGTVVGISISDSEETVGRGYPPWQVNRMILQMVAALFGQGVSVVFGHDWREDGVMEAVHGFARQMQSPLPLSPASGRDYEEPLLRNLVPWPDELRLSRADLDQLASTLRVERVGLPSELKQFENGIGEESGGARLFRYVRARGLTNLRHRLSSISQARVCLGGSTRGAEGRYPGVIEEALFALQDNRPLYLAGLLGGATRQLIDALKHEPMPDGFCPPTGVDEIYVAPPIVERDPSTQDDRSIDRKGVWMAFAEVGTRTVSRSNGLSIGENEELFRTPVLDRVIELVLVGLSRLRADGRV